MNRWLTVGCLAAVSAFVLVGGAAVETASGVGAAFPAAMQETTSSTLDGVFTAAQARRGRRVYKQNCASCHGQGLRGGEMAPSVAGSDFIVFWTEVPVGVLFCQRSFKFPQVWSSKIPHPLLNTNNNYYACGRLWAGRSVACPSPGGRAQRVHGDGSVHRPRAAHAPAAVGLTTPDFSFSFSRYESPRMLIVVA